MHYASLNGHTECVKVLLMHEASPNLPDNHGTSPLHLAAWSGHHEIVKLLLTQANRPANPNLQVIFSINSTSLLESLPAILHLSRRSKFEKNE